MMPNRSIAIDGYNMAMMHGTGVATYGVGVVQVARAMGFDVQGLFGIPVGIDPRIREIMFYEAIGQGALKRKGRPLNLHVADRWALAKGLPVFEIEQGGLVVSRGFSERLPAFDRIRSAPRLFERAEMHFRRTRRFLKLRVPDPPAIMHWTYPVPITLEGAANIYTLHDLVPLKLPYATLDKKKLYYRLIEQCVAGADHLITVSQSSRNDIISMFGAAPEHVTNTYQHAPMPQLGDGDHVADLEGIFDVAPGGYFLYFGAIEPKKNIGRMVEAYLSIATETPLVIVGARAWQSEGELRLITPAALNHGHAARRRIIQLEYLPRRLLMKLAAGARAVLFPSLYEGFGLPVLEAMQLGTPVITGDQGSLPEVAGDGAMLVDPYDVGAMAEAMRRVDRDPVLRMDLRARGLAQAERFSFERHREALGGVYEALLARPHGAVTSRPR